MYIAMNRFRVHEGHEQDFEKIWRERESYLDEVPGFREFHLLRGDTEDGITTYLSHSVWESSAAFEDWTNSESFRKAHAEARTPKGTLEGHPRFEGYEAVL
jgi:heme-degrading monooxygenase HmoA